MTVPDELPLTRPDFREWLIALGDERVGFSHEVDRCPLAIYLREQGVNAVVGKVRGQVAAMLDPQTPDARIVPLPVWVAAFVEDIDRAGQPFHVASGAAALGVLDGVPDPQAEEEVAVLTVAGWFICVFLGAICARLGWLIWCDCTRT